MSVTGSQITGVLIVYSTVCLGIDQRKHSMSLAFVREIQRWPVNSPRKRSVTRKTFPFDDVIMPLDNPTKVFWQLMVVTHKKLETRNCLLITL